MAERMVPAYQPPPVEPLPARPSEPPLIVTEQPGGWQTAPIVNQQTTWQQLVEPAGWQPPPMLAPTELGITPDGQAVFIDHRIYEDRALSDSHLRFYIPIPRDKFLAAQLNEDLETADVQCPGLALVRRLYQKKRLGTPNVEALLKFRIIRHPNSGYMHIQNHHLQFNYSLSVEDCMAMLRRHQGDYQQQPQRLSFAEAAATGFQRGYNRPFTKSERMLIECWQLCSARTVLTGFFLTMMLAIVLGLFWVVGNRSMA